MKPWITILSPNNVFIVLSPWWMLPSCCRLHYLQIQPCTLLCIIDSLCISLCSLTTTYCLLAAPVVALLTGNRKLPIYISLRHDFIVDVSDEAASSDVSIRFILNLFFCKWSCSWSSDLHFATDVEDLFITVSRLERNYKILFRAKKREGNKTESVEIVSDLFHWGTVGTF